MIWAIVAIPWLLLIGLILNDALRDPGNYAKSPNQDQRYADKCEEAVISEHPVGPSAQTDEQLHRTAERRYWRNQTVYNVAVGILTLAAAGAAVTAAVIAFGAYTEAKRQSDIAFRGLVDVQRAFVFASEIKLIPFRDRDGKLQYWRITLILENSGATPTKDMHWTLEPMYSPALDPETIEITTTTEFHPGFLGPKAKFSFWDGITNRTAEERIMRGEKFFLLGRVNYFDTLTTERRTTKFCFQIYGPPWRANLPAGAVDMLIDSVDLSANMCRRNNCADSECKK